MAKRRYLRLEKREFIARSKDFSRENLKFMYGLSKGISLSMASLAFVCTAIAWKRADFAFTPGLVMRMLLLADGWVVLMVTHFAVMMASVFPVHYPKRAEMYLTFVVLCCEFVMFILLAPEAAFNQLTPPLSERTLFASWFFAYGAYTLCATGMILHALSVFRKEHYPQRMWDLAVSRYAAQLRVELYFTIVIGPASILAGVYVWLDDSQGFEIAIAVASAMLIATLSANWTQHRKSSDIEKGVIQYADEDQGA